ncbi:MAG: GNAT family N-acetyltransferase [Christensenellales bacterium]
MGILKNLFTKIQPHKESTKSEMMLFDENNDLTWNRINLENLSYYQEQFKQIGEWSSNPNVQRFIASKTPLDKLFESMLPKNSSPNNFTGLFLCSNKEKLIGLIYTTSPLGEYKHTTIDYIIVNPELQGKGYGTRMIKSIKDNILYFSNQYNPEGIISSVEEENISSCKAFESNGFKQIDKNTSSTGRLYKIYYFKSPITKNTEEKTL